MTATLCIAPRCLAPRELGAVFCQLHLAATPGQRGGWLSAARRKTKLVTGGESMLDASNIRRRLWIGAKPPFDRDLPAFDIVVLCAQEIQPKHTSFHGRTLRCPLPDSALSQTEIIRALSTGKEVAQAHADGATILVTCAMGRNRSALVTGLAMGLNFRMPASEIVELIRSRRNANCLTNPHFVRILDRYIGEDRR